jgi:hypothetical protein
MREGNMSYEAPASFIRASDHVTELMIGFTEPQFARRAGLRMASSHTPVYSFAVTEQDDGKCLLDLDGDIQLARRGANGNPTGGTVSFRADGSFSSGSMNYGTDGVLGLGEPGRRGYINLYNDEYVGTIALDGEGGFVRCNVLTATDELQSERILIVGREDQAGLVQVLNDRGIARCEMNGQTGQIHTVGGDCAEYFEIADGSDASPGTVMVVDHDRTVRPSEVAYDRRVAGAVSGAGSTQPGLLLGTDGERSVPIALAGTVTVKMTADERPVDVGDLVVSSPVAGHAMAADDPTRSFGAVIGKALGSLSSGHGLVPVLVSLQ